MSGGREYPDRPFLAASCAVFRDGRVLVAARGRPPLRGLFSLPGGLVETGETLAEAALRELREETGITAEIVGFVRPVEVVDRDPDGRVRTHFVIGVHAARWLEGEGETGPEALELRWMRPDEVVGLHGTPELAAIVSEAARLMGHEAPGGRDASPNRPLTSS